MAGAFNADFEGIGEMLRSDFIEAEMKRRVDELGLPYAESEAPIGDPRTDPHSSRYHDSFVTSSGRDGGYEHDRAYGRLENISEEALWVEVGSKNNEAHHVLGRAMDVMSA